MNPCSIMPSWALVLAVLLPALAGAAGKDAAKVSAQELLGLIDKRMSFTSDYKGTVRMREIRKDGVERALEMLVYRRDKTKDLLFVLTQPRSMAGGGYLRVDMNLWEYNPLVGQWQRSTRRANIASTITCESDFDRSRLNEDYTAKDDGVESVDGTSYRKLLLTARPGVDITFPMLRIWVDPDNNIVKRIGYSPSGRVLRTDIIRSYQRLKDPSSGELVYHYKEVLEFEEEEGTKIVVHYDDVELAPLSPNIFTKAWLEGRNR
ncbi:outer membrane lipoprotein-sorting protein [Archangium lipolyticum]|uniref:outer membrane lipoprotein-sorting protein n=1 Tax=Archangium lipolyticum TaxID=2970465 RepID=UPI00214A19A6|nr:outer membrane lipoprotein-sorting protein [Archangium lipolyticum]